jgi:hypothetical protein
MSEFNFLQMQNLQECWCKKGAPNQELFTSYKLQQALPAERSSSSGRGSSSSGCGSSAAAEQVAALTAAADVIGQLLQNHHQVRATWMSVCMFSNFARWLAARVAAGCE